MEAIEKDTDYELRFPDLENYTPQQKEDYDEKIDNTVCYAELIKDIEELSAVKHYHLVETLAEEITSECFKRALVNEVTISVKKPDIIESTKSVGFKMSVKKSA